MTLPDSRLQVATELADRSPEQGAGNHCRILPSHLRVPQVKAVAAIAGEQLVAAFAGQHHLHLFGASFETKYSETLDGQVIGSSSCQISRGRALKKSSMPTTTSWCSVPIRCDTWRA